MAQRPCASSARWCPGARGLYKKSPRSIESPERSFSWTLGGFGGPGAAWIGGITALGGEALTPSRGGLGRPVRVTVRFMIGVSVRVRDSVQIRASVRGRVSVRVRVSGLGSKKLVALCTSRHADRQPKQQQKTKQKLTHRVLNRHLTFTSDTPAPRASSLSRVCNTSAGAAREAVRLLPPRLLLKLDINHADAL